jgi:hypothetical protein
MYSTIESVAREPGPNVRHRLRSDKNQKAGGEEGEGNQEGRPRQRARGARVRRRADPLRARIFNIEDELTKAMDTLEVQQIFDKQESKLQRVFNKWCAADKTAFTEAENNTMNLDEWSMFLGKAGICLLGPDLTERAARSIFVQVNLDDELFEQSDSDNDASELVYDEFIECLLRVAIHIDRMVNKKKSIANLETLEGVDVVLDAFLTNELIPRALKKK